MSLQDPQNPEKFYNRANLHWIYKHLCPGAMHELKWYRPDLLIVWLLAGNDDDGIFGEEPTSGNEWIEKYDMKWVDGPVDAVGPALRRQGKWWDPGKLTFGRWLAWTRRNPLHHFTRYVVGFKWMPREKIKRRIWLHIGEDKPEDMILPFKKGGFSVQTFWIAPLISWSIPLWDDLYLEGYAGWRRSGSFGLKLRGKRK